LNAFQPVTWRLAIHAEDFGQFDLAFGEFSSGRALPRERRLQDVAFRHRERFALLNLFGQVPEIGLEKNLRLLGSQFYNLFLCVLRIVLRAHLIEGALHAGFPLGE
jgi:hypothetical protein